MFKLLKAILLLNLLFILQLNVDAQNCTGASISTKENYQYGRFEVRMQSADGDGVVSSFFLYNVDLNCNWPQENNEIDIEMTGNEDALIHFTTHYPGSTNPWFFGDTYNVNFNPHNGFQNYAFEWEPGIVRWFVNDNLVYVQNQNFVSQLQYPMRILMNLWAAEATSWVGVWDPAIMPVESKYDWVKYYEYTPNSGNYGSNNNFTFAWQENFDSLNTERWQVSDFGGFAGNYCTFQSNNVEIANGQLTLKLQEEQQYGTFPVRIRLNAYQENFAANDNITINGNFNNWCGNCAFMNFNGNFYERILWLQPGKYEFVFGLNNWMQTGQPQIGDVCDLNPCDTYPNYGFVVPVTSSTNDTLKLPTYCWNQCSNCNPVYDCPVLLDLNSSYQYLGSGNYRASNSIVSNNTIENGENATFYAGNNILLTNGFSVSESAGFTASISNCY